MIGIPPTLLREIHNVITDPGMLKRVTYLGPMEFQKTSKIGDTGPYVRMSNSLCEMVGYTCTPTISTLGMGRPKPPPQINFIHYTLTGTLHRGLAINCGGAHPYGNHDRSSACTVRTIAT